MTVRRLGVWTAAALTSAVWLRPFFTSAFLRRAPIGDRGVFIAASKLIAGGAVPYRDVYDHKQPMIHLLGALAWTVSPRVEAVLRLEQVALIVLAGAMFGMLRNVFGLRFTPALVGLSAGLITLRNPAVFQGGHLTEEYGILFVMAALTCAGCAARPPSSASAVTRAYGFAAGALAALALLTREACIVPLALIGFVLHRRGPAGAALHRPVVWELAGFVLPWSVWLLFLWHAAALGAYFDVFRDNWAYAGGSRDLGTLLRNPVAAVGALGGSVLAAQPFLACGTAVVAFAAVAGPRLTDHALPIPPAVLVAWFGLELAAIAAAGHFFGHYYIALVPVWAAMFGVAAEVMLPQRRWATGTHVARIACGAALLAMVAWGLDWNFRLLAPTGFMWGFPASPALSSGTAEQLARLAAEHALRNYVPLTANDTSLWLEMPLPLATRFFYQFPWLFRPDDGRRQAELLRDLTRADVVVANVDRPRLAPQLESAVAALLESKFRLTFTDQKFEFYTRAERE